MKNTFIAAAIQMDSQQNVDDNLHVAEKFIREAAKRGAKLITMPENMNYCGPDSVGHAEEVPGGRTFQLMSSLAKELSVWLHCGSIYEINKEDDRPYNSTMIINPDGEFVAKYHKIHPFDIVIPGGVENRESDRISPGNHIVTVDTKDCGILGLSICYDMRFSELYRIMALEGAQILMMPADFTMPTGKDHWECILRTRAIENGCYVIAPAQIGQKPKFAAYGNTLIVDPWGNVIARASNKPGVITAEIDLDYMDKVRNQLFSLQNRRPDIYTLERA
ncbi:carbon-nitrogen hydrolase family protein [uncultured Levyella sp.]|uniref:carbon-nitrogen hydrolase family protein n=1 Tax=uncultured Levyella sp. TaxID=1715800 RepID=UPI002587A6F9|nr:carbon-nitrogen hydrolase family protein [uncultured Levyella sp.]